MQLQLYFHHIIAQLKDKVMCSKICTMKGVINRMIDVVTWRPGLGRLISNWKISLIMAELAVVILTM